MFWEDLERDDLFPNKYSASDEFYKLLLARKCLATLVYQTLTLNCVLVPLLRDRQLQD